MWKDVLQRFPFSRRDSSDIRGSRFPDVLDTHSLLAAKIYPCARFHRPHRWCVEFAGLARRRTDQTTRIDCWRFVGARLVINYLLLLYSSRWAACNVQPFFLIFGSIPHF